MIRWPFTRRTPTASDAARALATLAADKRAERLRAERGAIREKAREMRERLGMPASEALL